MYWESKREANNNDETAEMQRQRFPEAATPLSRKALIHGERRRTPHPMFIQPAAVGLYMHPINNRKFLDEK